MASANPIVKCTVDQCTHYMPGDQCMAAKISIYNDERASESHTVADTQCKSFHQRKTVGDVVGSLHNANVGGTISAKFMEGTQITPAVECFVNDCRYWHTGNLCDAADINVAGPNAAQTADTDCGTFARK